MKHCKPNSMRPLHLLSPIALAIIATTSPVLLAAEQQEVQQKNLK
ncbi:hypothetical protein [Pseudoalteromonas sp. B160]